MRKANPNRLLLLLTVVFIIIAAVSFAAFANHGQVCMAQEACTPTPVKKGGEILWDRFSSRLVSMAR